jgi:hypothetical protein
MSVSDFFMDQYDWKLKLEDNFQWTFLVSKKKEYSMF